MQRDFSRWADSKTDCIEISCLSHLLTKRDQRRINTESKLMRHAFRVYSLQDQSSASFCLQLISSWLFCSLLQSCDCSDFPVKDLDYFLLFLPWVSPSVVITVTWLVLLCSVSVHYRSWNIPVVFFWITKVLFSRVTDCFSGSFFFFCKNSFLSLSFDDENSFLSSHRFFVAGGCDSDDFLVYLRDCLSLEKKEQSHGRGPHSSEQVQEDHWRRQRIRGVQTWRETGMDDYSFKFPGLVLSLVVLKSMVMMMEVGSSLPPSFTPWLVFFSFRSLLPPERKRETAVGRRECVFIIKNRKRNSRCILCLWKVYL